VFTRAAHGVVSMASDKERRLLDGFLEAISRPLARPFPEEEWARRVGPIYVPKSKNSWRLRMRKSPLKTVALWSAWRLLPRTRALVRGARRPDGETQEKIGALVEALRALSADSLRT
jgi:hypothetical protein